MRMEKVIKIFREIQSTSGKNDKQAIIARNQDDMLFKDCLVFQIGRASCRERV